MGVFKKGNRVIAYARIRRGFYRNTAAPILRDFGSFAMLDVPGAYLSLSESDFVRIPNPYPASRLAGEPEARGRRAVTREGEAATERGLSESS